MDATKEEKELADQVELQNDLKNLIDESDPETLRRLKELITKRGKG